MSDPSSIDPIVTGGGGLGIGGIIVALLVKSLGGSALEKLEKSIEKVEASVEASRNELSKALMEQKHDTKEQISSVKELLEKAEAKYDALNREFGVIQRDVAAFHRRGDMIDHAVAEIERRLARIEVEVKR